MEHTKDGKPIIRIGNPNKKAQELDASSKVVKREFKSFLKRSEAPAKFVSLPEKLPEINSSPPKVVERDFSGCETLHVKRAVLSEESWTTKACAANDGLLKESQPSFFSAPILSSLRMAFTRLIKTNLQGSELRTQQFGL